jgi:DNA polymerase I
MPTFHDIRIASWLTNSLSRGSFAEFMERETGYSSDGSLEGKIGLMQVYEWTVKSETWKEQVEWSRFIFELESKLLPILAEMEMRWVRLDTTKLAEIGERISQGIKNCETEIYEVTGEFFNLNSPKQVAEILFGKLGIKPTKKNKTGYSVDTEVLEEIAKDYDVARLIIEHRTLSKLQSTYVESLLKVADKQTHRVHTTYSQLGAATGRMSSNDPNLQNIPTGIGYASEIKSCFIPSEGNILLVADYSQIEIRVLAWLSQDSALLEAFEKWEDIHARTAKFLFPGVSEISGEQRRIAKTVNFWVIYGITGFGLAKTLGAPSWEAQKYIEAFYEKYPGVKSYYEKILEDWRERWYVETAYGRRRYIPWLRDANKMVRSAGEREAINMPIQGTAADMLKIAMLDIDAKVREKWLKGSMMLQVHDELVFDIPKDEVEIWEKIVRESMEWVIQSQGGKYKVESKEIAKIPPIRVDMHTGENWVAAKG